MHIRLRVEQITHGRQCIAEGGLWRKAIVMHQHRYPGGLLPWHWFACAKQKAHPDSDGLLPNRVLAMTYFRTGIPHYHRRNAVSRSCSGWEGVGPARYGRQEFGVSSVSLDCSRRTSNRILGEVKTVHLRCVTVDRRLNCIALLYPNESISYRLLIVIESSLTGN